MPKLRPTIKNSVAETSLVPVDVPEIVAPVVVDLRSLIDRAVTEEDWLAIFRKAKDEALDGNARSREFLVKYRYGLPPQMVQHSGAVGMQVRIVEVVRDDVDREEIVDAEVEDIFDN